MKKGLFFRLAIDGIRKNRKLYIPYIISIAGMVTIVYLLVYAMLTPALSQMEGETTMRLVMLLGANVMSGFSVGFLFYTNSFLAKRRNSEFGLYNILGMSKKNIVKVLGCETFLIGVAGIGSGTVAGIVLSKLFELMLLKICGYETSYTFYFCWQGIIVVAVVYALLLFLLFRISARKIKKNKTVDLMKSSHYGETEPKANPVLAIFGFVLLIGAYAIAVSIKNPIDALNWFFIAVLMVIGATDLLFVSGSVFICKILRKNKRYYYNPRHFVPVSGMMYRMKRNGRGLSTICILSTMVLVMISSAGSLYFGKTMSLKTMYPSRLSISVEEHKMSDLTQERIDEVSNIIKEIAGEDFFNEMDSSRDLCIMGYHDGNTITGVPFGEPFFVAEPNTVIVHVVPLDQTNAKNGLNETLSGDEAFIASNRSRIPKSINLLGKTFEKVKNPYGDSIYQSVADITLYYFFVVDDFEGFSEYVDSLNLGNVTFVNEFTYDGDLSKDELIKLYDKLFATFNGAVGVNLYCRDSDAASFAELYGSLFVLGIFLSIIFMGACVLIMYYKQITEGYEDAHSYETMRKVGMTLSEIKKGINSQTLITFFSPLAVAGIHLAFSFPLVQKIVAMFGIIDVPVLVLTYVLCYIAFAVFYLVVYLKTVKEYVEIVSY